MIDIHSHLLPGVDDGSRSADNSAAVLRQMRRGGVSSVCLTPHFSVQDLEVGRLSAKLKQHDDAFTSLKEHCNNSEIPSLYRGSELMLDQPIPVGHPFDSAIRLGGSRYVLVEFPPSLNAAAIRGLVKQVIALGHVPLIAHVERYSAASLNEVRDWRDAGAAVQVDATTLSSNSAERGQRARRIVEAGLADILAADNHGDSRMLPTAATYLRKNGADAQAEYLLRINPRAILQNEALEPVPPVRLRKRIFQFLRALVRAQWAAY